MAQREIGTSGAANAKPKPPRGALVESLVRALEVQDEGARRHAQGVAWLAVRVARDLGESGQGLQAIQLGATLHDIGKLCVPAQVLRKRGPLTADEWRLMRSHPTEGYRILKPLVASADALAVVRWHHERWDGGGYPDALEGDTIPVLARIVAVVDAFAAMTQDRPYRKARRVTEALAELEAHAGTQFDPASVAALTTLVPTARAWRCTV